MKRIKLCRWLLLTLLVWVTWWWAATPAEARQAKVALGLYGVYGIPVIQDDVGAGPLYGGKVRADLTGPLAAEISYTSFQEGDVTFTARNQGQTIKGGTEDALCLNALLGKMGSTGLGFYVTGGLGSYTLKKDHREDVTGLGFNGGLGIEFRSSAGLAIDLSGRVHALPLDAGGSRKFGAIQAGINYYFLR